MLSYYSAMHWLGGSAMGRSSAWRGNCRWKKIPNLLGVILFLSRGARRRCSIGGSGLLPPEIDLGRLPGKQWRKWYAIFKKKPRAFTSQWP
jgi:hypothetical protein